MQTGLIILGALLVLIGGVWMGQGANLIGGSFMTGERTWLVTGAVAFVAGCGLLWTAVARRP